MRPNSVLHDARIVFLLCQLAHQGICGLDIANLILTDNIIQPQLVSAAHENRAFVKLYRLAELLNSFSASGCRLGCFQVKVKLLDIGRNLQSRISPVPAAFADKTFLGNRSMRVYTGDALEGKMLIAFVALIIRNRMYTKLKDEEEKLLSSPNFMNVPAAIRELEKIEMIRQADGVYRLDHAVTANQKIILKAFGIDANYIKRKAEQISNELNPKVLKVKINGRKS